MPAGFPLHDEHHAFAVGSAPHPPSCGDQPSVAEGVASRQVIEFGAMRLLVPLDLEAGAVPSNHSRCADIATAPFGVAAGDGNRLNELFLSD